MDNSEIKRDFNKIYKLMKGMPLRKRDRLIYLVRTLCCDNIKCGYVEGIKVGVRLREELEGQNTQ